MPIAAAVPAIIGAVGSVAGGYLSASGARSAANAQAAGANQASQTQLHIYDQIRHDLSPFLKTGTGAINSLASLFGFGNGGHGPTPQTMQNALATFRNTPGYQFSYDQGLNAIDRSAASRGMLLSGGQLKDAQTYGQGVADQGYGNYFNQLFQLSGLGENAGAATGNAGVATGQGVAGSQIAAGNALAGGQAASTNNLLSGLGSGLQNALLAYQLQQSGGGGYSGLSQTLGANAGYPIASIPDYRNG